MDVRVGLEAAAVALPCGVADGPALREALWRQTGADMPGESADYACACGATHRLRIVEPEGAALTPRTAPARQSGCCPR